MIALLFLFLINKQYLFIIEKGDRKENSEVTPATNRSTHSLFALNSFFQLPLLGLAETPTQTLFAVLSFSTSWLSSLSISYVFLGLSFCPSYLFCFSDHLSSCICIINHSKILQECESEKSVSCTLLRVSLRFIFGAGD